MKSLKERFDASNPKCQECLHGTGIFPAICQECDENENIE